MRIPMRHWSFNRQIALASLTVVIAFAILAVAALAGFVFVERTFEGYQNRQENVQTINQIQMRLKDIRLIETDAILESDADLLSTYPNRTADLFKDLEGLSSGVALRSQNQPTYQTVESLKAALLKRKDLSDQILRAAVSGDSDKALELYDFTDKENMQIQEFINSTSAELSAYETSRVAGIKQELNRGIRNWIVGVALLALGCISLVPSIVHSNMSSVRRQLARSVDNILDSAQKVEPLLRRIDEFGSKFRQGKDASQTALNESGAAIQMLADSLMRHADDIGKTATFVGISSDETEKSQTTVVTISDTFRNAQENNDALIKKIEAYSARIEEVLRTIEGISEKTRILNDLVFQTRIISINASVEAARAGEAGRGFSIVAEELTHLSQSTGQSAKDFASVLESGLSSVESLLKDSQEDFSSILTIGREIMERGTRASAQCSESIFVLAKTNRDLSDLVGDSGQALQTQLARFASVSESLRRLNESVFTEAHLSENYTHSMQELKEQSDNLKGLARNLASGLKGNAGSSLRSSLEESSGSNEMVEDILKQPEEPEKNEATPAVTRESEVRRRRSKSNSQRRTRELITVQPNELSDDSQEMPIRRKA